MCIIMTIFRVVQLQMPPVHPLLTSHVRPEQNLLCITSENLLLVSSWSAEAGDLGWVCYVHVLKSRRHPSAFICSVFSVCWTQQCSEAHLKSH